MSAGSRAARAASLSAGGAMNRVRRTASSSPGLWVSNVLTPHHPLPSRPRPAREGVRHPIGTPRLSEVVRPGEKIPLDGTVLEGDSQVDTSPLTGESVPLRLMPGSRVHAGTINLNGALRIEVTAVFAESSIARILEMVETAVARKAPTERFITRMARWYTPAVTGIALLVAVVPPILGFGDFSQWLYRALVLLVISCPCALLISIPLGYFGGIGAASRRGILIKGGAVLDSLRDIRVAALDKTGTLTEGVFEVNAVLPAPGIAPNELLATAALAESRSNHPIARSVMRAALAADIVTDDTSITDMQEIPGKGVIASAASATFLAGNAALMEDHGIAPQAVTIPGSVVQVAQNGRLLGAIVVADRLKPQSPEAIEAAARAAQSKKDDNTPSSDDPA